DPHFAGADVQHACGRAAVRAGGGGVAGGMSDRPTSPMPSFPRRRESMPANSRLPLMEKQPAVYLLASERNGTLYTGVTSDLVGRTWQHREHVVDGFTKRYGIATLVWYELHPTMESAILREKQIKKWNRSWKLRLIQE